MILTHRAVDFLGSILEKAENVIASDPNALGKDVEFAVQIDQFKGAFVKDDYVFGDSVEEFVNLLLTRDDMVGAGL